MDDSAAGRDVSFVVPAGRTLRLRKRYERTPEGLGMSDEDEEADEPAVELGEGTDVEGAPLARVSHRLHYGIEHSEVVRREGDTVIRTPDGPRELGDVLEETEETYFETRNALENAVEAVVGTGPVPTAED
jgi:hypothetical protein